MGYVDTIAFWIERAKTLNCELDYSKLSQDEAHSLIYAASHLYEKLEKAFQTINKSEQRNKSFTGGYRVRTSKTKERNCQT